MRRDDRSRVPTEKRESEGPVGATTPGNGRDPDPAEQRGPVSRVNPSKEP